MTQVSTRKDSPAQQAAAREVEKGRHYDEATQKAWQRRMEPTVPRPDRGGPGARDGA